MNLVHIGRVHSHLIRRTSAPRQAHEGAPHASLEIRPAYIEALDGLKPGMDIWVLTWLHQADRNVLKTHPRSNPRSPLQGVFTTRSPDRPNLAAVFQGTLFAPGTWPPRSTPSCGYSGICVISPLNSPGDRTSISGFPALLCEKVS